MTTKDAARRVRRALAGDMSVTVTRSFMLDDIRVDRAADGGDGRTVTAYAAVFLSPTEILDHDGHYNEQIHPNSFDRSLKDRAGRIFSVYNHAKTLAGTPSGEWSVPVGKPLEMRADGHGLLTRTRYNTDPQSERILEAVKSGSLMGMSFTGVFLQSDPELPGGPWGQYAPDRQGNLPLVTRMEIALIEYGPTPLPAYEDAVVIGVRAKQARDAVTLSGQPYADPDHDGDNDATAAGDTDHDYAGAHVRGAPVHDTPLAVSGTTFDPQQNAELFQTPASDAHMQSLYAAYDTSQRAPDGLFHQPHSAGFLPHHVVGMDGYGGAAHPDIVARALKAVDSMPAHEPERALARAHLEAHMNTGPGRAQQSGSEVLVTPSGETGATNGQGTLVSQVPTASAGRQPLSDGERQRAVNEYFWEQELAQDRAAAHDAHDRAGSFDDSAWNAQRVWSHGADLPEGQRAAYYSSVCAGRRDGDPSLQSSHALPHHYEAGGPPNASGVSAALGRFGQTHGLTNSDAARSHLEAHERAISAAKGDNGTSSSGRQPEAGTAQSRDGQAAAGAGDDAGDTAADPDSGSAPPGDTAHAGTDPQSRAQLLAAAAQHAPGA